MRRKTTTVWVLLLFPFSVSAVPIEGLCNGTADSAVTCETESGLEWLDLTETAGLTMNEFLADVGGWVSAGWTAATGSLVDELLTSAGFSDLTPGNRSAESLGAAQTMLSTLGVSFVGNVGPFGQGLAINSDGSLSEPFYQVTDGGTLGRVGGSTNLSGFDFDNTFFFYGIWAYREPITSVPEPGTLALFCIGAVAGIALTRRRQSG